MNTLVTGLLALGVSISCALPSPGAAQSPGGPRQVKISKRDCQRLVRHVPSADVAYKPGVDARGRPVASADAGGRKPLRLPSSFTFDITFDLGALAGGAGAELTVGSVRYDINSGSLTFNGQPLTDPAQSELAARCQRVLRTGR